MNQIWKTILVAVVVGIAAFLAGPQLWPPGANVPAPPADLLPGYIAVAAIEALAFGLAIAFALFGWAKMRDIQLGPSWLNRVLYVSITWLLGNWWIHDGLHMHVGLDMSRLLYIEIAFHLTLLASGAALALGILALASNNAIRPQHRN